MDKLTAIKIKYQDGTYSEQIPIGASAQNIDWDENHSLVDILGEVDLSKGNIQRQINSKPDLGETSSTAYRGDRGKIAYNHATDSNRLTTSKSTGLYKVAATSEGHIANLTSVTKSDITNLGIPASDTNVTQTSSSTNASYEVLFSGTADDTTRTEGARKSSGLTFNPSTKNLTVTKINGVDVDDLQEKIKSGYYVNAMEHGAKGDGVTDDTAVLQNLLDNYVGVYLPKANPYYKVSQLKLHSRNHLLGCGQDSLIESYLNDDSSYIIITDDNAERPIIEKIRLIGNWHMSGINFKSTNLAAQTASKVIDCNIEKVINGIKFDQYQTECVVDRTIITGASQDGIIAPTSDCKFCNTTVGEIGRIGFNLKDSTQMQISDCKAYTCGKTTIDDTFGLGSDGYGVWINTYSVITNLTLEGMYRNGLFMRYGNVVSGLELNSFNYITYDGIQTSIDSYAIVLENNNNHITGTIIDGHYSYGDYLIGLTAQSRENNIVDLVVRKETTAQHGTSHLLTSNVSLKNNTIIINGQTIEGEILEANLLRGGIELPSNANLNDYIDEYRNYYCSSGSVGSMSNKPTSVGFTMKVSSALGVGVGKYQYIKQTVTEYLPPFKTYERLYTKATQTFSDWVQVSGNYSSVLQVVKTGVLNSSNTISFTVPDSSHLYLLVWGYVTSCGVYVLTAGTTTVVNEVMKTDQYTTVTNNNGAYTVTCQSPTSRKYFIIGI